ncbi:hypothetical protein ACHQM5_015140 [Ranunculus cassubicifolius]
MQCPNDYSDPLNVTFANDNKGLISLNNWAISYESLHSKHRSFISGKKISLTGMSSNFTLAKDIGELDRVFMHQPQGIFICLQQPTFYF